MHLPTAKTTHHQLSDLETSELRYRRLFETAQDGIILLDFDTGMILDVNKFLIDLLGYSKARFLKKHLWDVGVFKNVASSKKQFTSLQARRTVRFEDLPLVTKTGKHIDVEFVANAYQVDGETTIQCNIRDITDRKKAEYIATVSELRYCRLFETAQDGILLIDFFTGMILDVNKFLIDLLGYSKSDFLKKFLWQVGVFKDIAASKSNFLTLQKKRYVRFEDLPLQTKSGKKIDVEFIANAYQVDSTSIIQCNIRDITDRKRAEYLAGEALQQSEEKFSKAFQTSPYAITITRMDNGKFVEVNDAFVSLTGYSRQEAIGSSSTGLKLWLNEKDRNHMVADLHAGRPVVSHEYMFRTKKGEVLPGLFSAQTIQLSSGSCILSSIADISERKKMEEKIREMRDLDEAILDSIGDAVLACDHEGKVILFNKMAERLTGLPTHHAIGHHYHQVVNFIKEADNQPGDDFITEAITKNKITQMANHTILIRKDGIKIPVADSAAPIKDSLGHIIGCVVVFHDVTKDRQIDKTKTEFVSLASHQLRTPLSTINWYSEMLLSGDAGQLNSKQSQYTKEVHHASKRMCELVNALLNVSRLELGTFSIEPKPADIKSLIKICIKDLRHQILEKKLSLTQHYDPQVKSLSVDSKLFSIIIQNLLSNAVKYTPVSGKVRIKLGRDNTSILIQVSDTGIGIPREQQNKIFDKLYRADNAKALDPDGSGLGLYIASTIITNSGGKIWFQSNKKAGSSFFVTFPPTGMKSKTGSKQLS